MNRIFKTLLLWLLMAALPIQGFAAAIKASCGQAHLSSVPAVSIVKTHDHGDRLTNHHHADATGDASGHDEHGASSSVADKSSDAKPIHKSSYCSACALCCVGAVALPSSHNWTPEYSSSEFIISPPAVLATGYIPAGLERPPRQVAA